MGRMHGRAIHGVAQLFMCLLLLGEMSIAAAAKSDAGLFEVSFANAEVAQSASKLAQAPQQVASAFERREHGSNDHDKNQQSPCGHGNCSCCCISCAGGGTPTSILPFDNIPDFEAAEALWRPMAQSGSLTIWLAFLPFRPPCSHA